MKEKVLHFEFRTGLLFCIIVHSFCSFNRVTSLEELSLEKFVYSIRFKEFRCGKDEGSSYVLVTETREYGRNLVNFNYVVWVSIFNRKQFSGLL